MKITARRPSPDSFLLEFRPEAVQMPGPYVTLAYEKTFGDKPWRATVAWSAIGRVQPNVALEFAAAARSAALTAHDLEHGTVTVDQLLVLWGPHPTVAPESVPPPPPVQEQGVAP
jgi:hypothetical protein